MFGYSYYKYVSLHWRSLPYGLALLSPPSKAANVSETLLRYSILRQIDSCLYIRFEKNFDKLLNSPWWHVIKDDSTTVELESFGSKIRSQIRRGLKNYTCRLAKLDDIELLYDIYAQTQSEYKTFESTLSLPNFLAALHALPVTSEFWVVIDNSTGETVGFSENYIEDYTCFYNSIWILRSAMKNYAAYALFYEMNRHYLLLRKFKYVSDGARSLSHDTQIHSFLIRKFGFRKAYSTLSVVYVRWLSILVTLIYPFSSFISSLPFTFARKLTLLLLLEKISRQCRSI